MNVKIDGYSEWRNETISAKAETDKKYMILRMGSSLVATAGLGWYILHTFIGIEIALENGYIPVVDWECGRLPQYPYETSRRNIWELFFEQPCKVSLKEAYESEDYWVVDDVLSMKESRDFFLKDYTDFYAVRDRRHVFQRYVRFNNEFQKKIDHAVSETIDVHSLGVLVRGTDYKNLKPMHHPKCIPLEKVYELIDKYLGKEERNKIYVATEDNSILDKLKIRYRGRISYLESPRYDQVGDKSLNLYNLGKMDGEDRDSRYLLSLAVLAKCPSMILSPCGGSIVASLMHDNVIKEYCLCFEGYYSHKAYVFVSKLETDKGELLYINHRPLIYYALNTLFLMRMTDITLVTTLELKEKMEPVLQGFRDKGINIRYVIGNGNNAGTVLKEDIAYYQDEAVCLYYEDNLFYGSYLGKEMNQRAKQFDGAYVWRKRPDAEWDDWEAFAGCLLFDRGLSRVVKQCMGQGGELDLYDILRCYRDMKKLICVNMPRGAMCVKLKDEIMAEQISELFGLLEKEMGQTIGDAVNTADSLQKIVQ